MKEVTSQRFEKGDFIRGKAGNGYCVTNGDMTRAVVTGVDDERGTMTIKPLELSGKPCSNYRTELRVDNSTDKFELLPKVNNTSAEDHILTISAAAEKGSNLVTAVVKYKGEFYSGDAQCAPEDEFDFRMGVAIAIGRAFDLVDAVELRRRAGEKL